MTDLATTRTRLRELAERAIAERPGLATGDARILVEPELVLALLAESPVPDVPETAGIDGAWRAAEAALLDGWRIDGLHNSEDGWFAIAIGKGGEEYTDTPYSDSPAAALRALAAALLEQAIKPASEEPE